MALNGTQNPDPRPTSRGADSELPHGSGLIHFEPLRLHRNECSSVFQVALAHLGERQTEVHFSRHNPVRYLEVLCSIHRSDKFLFELFWTCPFFPFVLC
ncbi:uncharacterized protein RCC_06494 [Ramularia collo-cygni]|uniref:Uncharacterized protein n=1 Tax=Ramularia collo-cygni TaxID=112498 RepID=A0A2D3VAF4_9PEZI|nr:uncharacterized protein RCC_06494 [Ramularia collo-cygni]CZT20636.1 uncharacterized protein RCC_06494 [Ramularia collo-cygni]